mgnify:CR=1 FL=1
MSDRDITMQDLYDYLHPREALLREVITETIRENPEKIRQGILEDVDEVEEKEESNITGIFDLLREKLLAR